MTDFNKIDYWINQLKNINEDLSVYQRKMYADITQEITIKERNALRRLLMDQEACTKLLDKEIQELKNKKTFIQKILKK